MNSSTLLLLSTRNTVARSQRILQPNRRHLMSLLENNIRRKQNMLTLNRYTTQTHNLITLNTISTRRRAALNSINVKMIRLLDNKSHQPKDRKNSMHHRNNSLLLIMSQHLLKNLHAKYHRQRPTHKRLRIRKNHTSASRHQATTHTLNIRTITKQTTLRMRTLTLLSLHLINHNIHLNQNHNNSTNMYRTSSRRHRGRRRNNSSQIPSPYHRYLRHSPLA